MLLLSVLRDHATLEQGSDSGSRNLPPQMTLHEAAERGRTTAIQLMLENGCSVNVTDLRQRTPLHLAAEKGHSKAVHLLLANGASVNAKDEDQKTPLHLAARAVRGRVVNVLMSHGANPFATNVACQTPLHDSAWPGAITVLSDLMKHVGGLCKCSHQHQVDPSNINAADLWGRTPLQLLNSIKPFVQLYGCLAKAPCVNVIDCEGSAEVKL